MRQASWNEMFAPRPASGGLVLAPEVPQEPRGWRRFLWWEDLLTFALMGVVFLAVIDSVNNAGWVDDMPSLHPIAFLGLLMGAVLARVRWPEGFIHLLAFPIGAAFALGQILAVVPGPSPWARFDVLEERMGDWFHAAFTGSISNDSLPFIVLAVALTWLAGSWIFVASATLLAAPMRPGAFGQLLSSPHFAAETLIGLLSGVATISAGVFLAFPSRTPWWRWVAWGAGVAALWFAAHVFALWVPALEPSMLGKRPFCVFEALAYGTPPMIVGLLFLRRCAAFQRAWAGAMWALPAEPCRPS